MRSQLDGLASQKAVLTLYKCCKVNCPDRSRLSDHKRKHIIKTTNNNEQQTNRICQKVYPAAERLAKAGGVSPLFVTAQAALETGWEIRGIGNNILGSQRKLDRRRVAGADNRVFQDPDCGVQGSRAGCVGRASCARSVQISRVSPFPCIPDRGRVPRRSLGAAEETDVRRCVALPG